MKVNTSKVFTTLTKEQLQHFDLNMYNTLLKAAVGGYEVFQKDLEHGKQLVTDLQSALFSSSRDDKIKVEGHVSEEHQLIHQPQILDSRHTFEHVRKNNECLAAALDIAERLNSLIKIKEVDTSISLNHMFSLYTLKCVCVCVFY